MPIARRSSSPPKPCSAALSNEFQSFFPENAWNIRQLLRFLLPGPSLLSRLPTVTRKRSHHQRRTRQLFPHERPLALPLLKRRTSSSSLRLLHYGIARPRPISKLVPLEKGTKLARSPPPRFVVSIRSQRRPPPGNLLSVSRRHPRIYPPTRPAYASKCGATRSTTPPDIRHIEIRAGHEDLARAPSIRKPTTGLQPLNATAPSSHSGDSTGGKKELEKQGKLSKPSASSAHHVRHGHDAPIASATAFKIIRSTSAAGLPRRGPRRRCSDLRRRRKN